jgi:cell division protein FtsL
VQSFINTKNYKMKNFKTQKQKFSFNKLNKYLFFTLIALAIMYVGTQVVVTSMVGTKSEEIENVRQQKADLRLQNEILTSKIDGAKSLEKARELAQKAGLENKNVNFLEKTDGTNVALN